jgi:hypothetical protein
VSDRDDDGIINVSWLGRIENYKSSMEDSTLGYMVTAEECIMKLNKLKTELDPRSNQLCNTLILFISEFCSFLRNLEEKNENWSATFFNGYELLKLLDELQEKYPKRYGSSTPNTPRSNDSSPRLDLSGSAGLLTKLVSILSPRTSKN